MSSDDVTPAARHRSWELVEDKTAELKAALWHFQGKIFHAVTTNNRHLKYKIGLDGRISLQSTKQLIEETLHKPKEVYKSAERRILAAEHDVRRRFRKTVTGDPEKRVRDHMKEVPQVKLTDKFSFTMGVTMLCLCQFFALSAPDYFPVFYTSLITFLFTLRFFDYRRDKFQFFMIDFCYFANTSCVIQSIFFPNNLTWFKINYVCVNGPLCFAVIVWHNSLVFHSLDKVTSFFLHVAPPLLMNIYRWGRIPSDAIKYEDTLSWTEFLVNPVLFYLTWQTIWFIITEVLLVNKFKEDLDLITSMRWLCRDHKNPVVKMFVKFLWDIGLQEKGVWVDPEQWKTKLLFTFCQFVYIFLTFLPTALLYQNRTLNAIFYIFILLVGTWNGASYYIEVFSKRYNLQFEAKERTSSQSKETQKDDNNVQNIGGDEIDGLEEEDDEEETIILNNDEEIKTISIDLIKPLNLKEIDQVVLPPTPSAEDANETFDLHTFDDEKDKDI